MKNVLVIGKSGQLAQELLELAPDSTFWGRDSIAEIDASLVSRVCAQRPSAIINAAAYTAVDKAETEQTQATMLNAELPALLAQAAHILQVPLVQVSTDYVFNGQGHKPYDVDESVMPLGVYGLSKAQGEKNALKYAPQQACILRTAWVYSQHGTNFVKTMLRLMAEKPVLSVVADQIGSPTWAKGLAKACLYACEHRVTGVHHWTDLGVASWYDFAVAIQHIGLELGLLKKAIPITPITSAAYPTPAARPHYSVLDKSSLFREFENLDKNHWRAQLRQMMEQLK